jgi:hypothetical protein
MHLHMSVKKFINTIVLFVLKYMWLILINFFKIPEILRLSFSSCCIVVLFHPPNPIRKRVTSYSPFERVGNITEWNRLKMIFERIFSFIV